MKTILRMLAVGVLCFGLAGCSDDDGTPSSSEETADAVEGSGGGESTAPASDDGQDEAVADTAGGDDSGGDDAEALGGTYGSLDVSGKWVGWYELGGVKNLLSLSLTQNGPMVGGTFTFSDAGSGTVADGLVSGDELSLELTRNSATFRMTGKVDLSAPSYIGQWEDDERGNSGTFSLR